MMNQIPKSLIPIVVIVILVLSIMAVGSTKAFQLGMVAVATLFGSVKPEPYEAGLHIPVNPLYDWHLYDVRPEDPFWSRHASPARTSCKPRLMSACSTVSLAKLPTRILKETGTAEDVVKVHIIPKLRSLIREQGKAVKRAEDFFLEESQITLQTALLEGLRDYLGLKGVEVGAVLLRDIALPPFITKAIEAKREREQEVEKQKAELERFRTEQQQLVASAQAERAAAEEQAAQRRVLADVQAYEIEKINTAIGKNPNYVKLQALEALKAISKDPAAKVYFINGDSPMPLPLMHLGESK